MSVGVGRVDVPVSDGTVLAVVPSGAVVSVGAPVVVGSAVVVGCSWVVSGAVVVGVADSEVDAGACAGAVFPV